MPFLTVLTPAERSHQARKRYVSEFKSARRRLDFFPIKTLTIKNEMLEKIAPPIEPLYDTWGGKKDAGSWCIAPSFDFTSLSTQEVNAWFVTSVVETPGAFADLARAWRVEFNTIYRDDVEGVRLEWQPGDFHDDYMEEVLKAIREYLAPIYSLDIEVDLLAYFRTKESPDIPVRAWVRLPSQFVIWGGPENHFSRTLSVVGKSDQAPSAMLMDYQEYTSMAS